MATKKTVGIKELKDQASAILRGVETKGHTVVIKNKNREVAKIVPLRQEGDTNDSLEAFLTSGLVARRATKRLDEVKLLPINLDPSVALKGMTQDREDG